VALARGKNLNSASQTYAKKYLLIAKIRQASRQPLAEDK
jgi:hypothetical protein